MPDNFDERRRNPIEYLKTKTNKWNVYGVKVGGREPV